MLPAWSRFVVIGAGMHGLRPPTTLPSSSGAGHRLGADVVVLEKATPGAGATGIACGVVGNTTSSPR